VTGALPISPGSLALAAGFLLVAAGLSLAFSLGMVRPLLVAALRLYLQLIALGFVLRWVFDVSTPLLVLALLLLMAAVGTQTLLARLRGAPRGLFPGTLGSLTVSCFVVTFAVTAVVVRVEPWYEPRYVIPIAGMVIGNSLNGMALCLDRLFGDLRARAAEIEALLCLGATPWEAVRPSARTAFRSALIPTINSMSAAGIVFIPGMMTGQVLAGADPGVAAGYQIVVFLMISAATTIGSIAVVLVGHRAVFDAHERFTLN